MAEIFGDISCDCDVCPCGAPRRFRLTVSGFQPCGYYPCQDCADLDGEYILETVGGCVWACEATHPCTGNAISWHLFISRNDDCTLQMEVYFGGGKPKPWTGTVDHCWPDATVLTGGRKLAGPGPAM